MDFTDDERFAVACALRDWIHGQPFSECGPGADTCPDWPLAFEIRDVALAALSPQRNKRVKQLEELLRRINSIGPTGDWRGDFYRIKGYVQAGLEGVEDEQSTPDSTGSDT